MSQPEVVPRAPLALSPPRAGRRWMIAAVLGLCALLAVAYASREHRAAADLRPGGAHAATASRPTPVVTALVSARDVPIYLDGLGNAVPISTVTVRSQVDGKLDRVLFSEGQTVRARDVIAEIDPRPFQIQLHQAQAALARDTAQLDNARTTLRRDQSLTADSLITRQQLEDQQALVHQYEANLAGDRAQIETAQLQLDYASVRAPSDGVTGVRLVDAGNLVRASDPNGLVVITQLDPMSVVFALPEDELARVNQALSQRPLRVEVSSRDGSQSLGTGTLALVDNQINLATATAKLKAIVPNAERKLWPNQFVKVRLEVETRPGALVLPAAAIQHGPDGTFVYVVGDDQRAQLRHVDVALVQDDQVVVERGLREGEQVVVEGQTQLRPNAPVTARPANAPAPVTRATPPVRGAS